MLGRIERDRAAAEKPKYVVFLGDLIDRGPDSCRVIERLRLYASKGVKPVFLFGNHEEAFLRVLGGDSALLADWLRYGGDACAASYGIDPARLLAELPQTALGQLQSAVPKAHIDFLQSFADSFRYGDYLFVHAGIRPGLSIEDQSPQDLRWIRDAFLHDTKDHGVIVVHGHTIVSEVEERVNRIGIDTGAYRTNRLTALGIEGRERWFLESRANPVDPQRSEG
ncbi:MAG: metallophosphoesterase [Sphingomonadaceae bacterium]|nr:metallophosphoesterase [Sphingomonadaceae bacterium]